MSLVGGGGAAIRCAFKVRWDKVFRCVVMGCCGFSGVASEGLWRSSGENFFQESTREHRSVWWSGGFGFVRVHFWILTSCTASRRC